MRRSAVLALASALALLVGGMGVGACSVDEGDQGRDAASDDVGNLEELAVGRWRCRGTAEGLAQDLLIAIAGDGRLGFVNLAEMRRMHEAVPDAPQLEYDLEDDPTDGGGTWKRRGLHVELQVPWYGEGAHGFHGWDVTGNDEPPEKVEARPTGPGGDNGGHDDADFEIEVHRDRVELVQVKAPSGTVSPRWRLSCSKLTSDPGPIPEPEKPFRAD